MSQQHFAGAPALNNWLSANKVVSGGGPSSSACSSAVAFARPAGGTSTPIAPSDTPFLAVSANTTTASSITSDALFVPDANKHTQLFTSKPWVRDPHYVKRCYISAVAVLKLIMHAQTGRVSKGAGGNDASAKNDEWLEVMGQLQGHVGEECVVLTDSFGIPVPATAVECGLDDAATNFLVQYSELTEKVGKPSKVFGWYHTHPGYTSFLSGTDVNTQRFQQMIGGPVVALVMDPVKTLADGKIELKAFRTYPEGYNLTPEDLEMRSRLATECLQNQMLGEEDPSAGLIGEDFDAASLNKSNGNAKKGAKKNAAATTTTANSSSTAANKKRDLAFFANTYYEVPITIFRSEKDAELLDQLWGRYWSRTFASSAHVEKRSYVNRQMGSMVTHLTGGSFILPSNGGSSATAAGGSSGGDEGGGGSVLDTYDGASSSQKGADSGKARGFRPRSGIGMMDDEARGMGGDAARYKEVLALSRNMGIDAVQGLLSAHVKKRIFAGGN